MSLLGIEEYRPSLDKLVVALCLDFDERDRVLSAEELSRRVRMEYKYLNCRMLEAAEEIAGSSAALGYIREIGKGVGYYHSRIENLSESTYKKEKSLIKIGIARKLHLID